MNRRDHGRYGYSALPDRPVYDWPGGKRLAVYFALNLETFSFGEGLGAKLAPAQGEPDVLNLRLARLRQSRRRLAAARRLRRSRHAGSACWSTPGFTTRRRS